MKVDSRSQTRLHVHFPYIDGLRGLSIIAVILFHLDAALLPAGFSGVDIFFVISGFVVSASLHGLHFDRFRDFAKFFYARRLRRIVPGLAVVLLASTAFTALFIPRAYLSSHIQETALSAFFGFSNIALALDSNGYFAPRAEYNPFTHTWSLGVEEQFYLVFPLLYFAFLRSQKARRVGMICLLALSASSLGYCLLEDNATFKFYMIFGRFWELGVGVGLYLLLDRRGRRPASGPTMHENKFFTILGAALIVSGFVVGKPELFPIPGGLMPVLGTALLILGLHGRRPQSWIAGFFVARPVIQIGILSYSLYLWHWPVFVLFRWTVGFETPGQKLVALFIAIFLSVASYQLIERPFRTSRLLRAPWAAIFATLLFGASCAWASQLIFRNENTISRSVVMQHQSEWYPDMDFAMQRDDGCRIERSFGPHSAGLIAIIEPKFCGMANADFTLFVIGDSHAHVYWSMLGAYALATGTRVVTYITPGCPAIELLPASQICKVATTSALADIGKHARRGDVMFMSSLNLLRFRDQWHVETGDVIAKARKQQAMMVRQELAGVASNVLGELSNAGLKVVFELPKPIFPTPLFRCSDWFNRMNPICIDGQELSRSLLEDYRLSVVRSVERIRESFKVPIKSFYIWDPFDVLCPEDPCRMTQNGKPLYFDGDHISAYGNRTLLPSFTAMIQDVRER